MAKSELSSIKRWITTHTGCTFTEYDKNTIMVDTDYEGPYPTAKVLNIHDSIRSYIRRHHASVHVESRGCYTGMLVEVPKNAQ